MGEQTDLIVRLMRVMFPYFLFVCVAAVFIGILNARGHYFMPAIGASLLNVVMIASVFLIAPAFGERLDTQVFGLAVGVLVAGFLQAAFQYPTLHREGFRFKWVNPIGDPTVREVVRRMAPATLGVAAYQFNVVLTSTLAVNEARNIVSSFNYAVRLMELPRGSSACPWRPTCSVSSVAWPRRRSIRNSGRPSARACSSWCSSTPLRRWC